MTLESLAIARDWAIIILAAQAIVFTALVAFLAWQLYRAMRKARPKVVHGLHEARHATVRASEGARRGVLIAARPFVAANSAAAGLRAGWSAWRRGQASTLRSLTWRR